MLSKGVNFLKDLCNYEMSEFVLKTSYSQFLIAIRFKFSGHIRSNSTRKGNCDE